MGSIEIVFEQNTIQYLRDNIHTDIFNDLTVGEIIDKLIRYEQPEDGSFRVASFQIKD